MSGDPDTTVAADAGHSLVARIREGDRAAETEFVRRYERGIQVLVRRHCRRGDAVVSDLAQDVLLRVLERLRAGAIRDEEALPAYVRATIVHTASAEYRGRRKLEPVSAAEGVPDADDVPEGLEAQQRLVLLKSLLAEMPVERDRQVLFRFYLNEEDRDDICTDLGIETTHFHRVVHRARERFRALLERSGWSQHEG